jgi:hypothetical protein
MAEKPKAKRKTKKRVVKNLSLRSLTHLNEP